MARTNSTPTRNEPAPHLGSDAGLSLSTSASNSADETFSEKRKQSRKPFGQHQQKLSWPEIPGFKLYWFVDDPGRVDMAKAAGWEHVLDGKGNVVTFPTGVARTGGVQTSYLMKLPQEWYDEDMAKQQEQNDATDRAIRAGSVLASDNDGRYIPSRGIKIRDELRRG